MKFTLDHDFIDDSLDWLKTLITINAGFIGVVLISSSNEVVKPISWVAVIFAFSLLMTLIAILGVAKHKKQKHSENLSTKAAIPWILGWISFLSGIGIICWKLTSL